MSTGSQEVRHGNGHRRYRVNGGCRLVFGKQYTSSILVNQIPQHHEQGLALVIRELSVGRTGGSLHPDYPGPEPSERTIFWLQISKL